MRRDIEDLDRDPIAHQGVERRPDRPRTTATEEIVEHEPTGQGVARIERRARIRTARLDRNHIRQDTSSTHLRQPTGQPGTESTQSRFKRRPIAGANNGTAETRCSQSAAEFVPLLSVRWLRDSSASLRLCGFNVR